MSNSMINEQSICTPSHVVYDSHTIVNSLVATHLQPILQKLTDIDAFLLELEPQIRTQASKLYYGLVPRGVDSEDLIQEGMIAAWKATQSFNTEKATNEHSLYAYCLTRAHGAMVDYLRSHYRTGGTAGSIEGLVLPEPAHQDRPQSTVKTRKQVNAALRQLTRRQRLVIKAHFGIETKLSGGTCLTRDILQSRYHMTTNSYCSARREALKKLSHLIQLAGREESVTC